MFDFDYSKLTPEQIKQASTLAERLIGKGLGLTSERIKGFIAESRAENDGDNLRLDSAGKFKHFLRTEHGWGSGVDAAWPLIEPFVQELVDLTLAQEAK